MENNYGNRSPASTLGHLTTRPDIDRVDFNPSTWSVRGDLAEFTHHRGPLGRLSIVDGGWTGTVGTYAKDRRGWYWAAPELSDRRHRGEAAHSLVEGRGSAAPANNYYGGLTVGPDGTAYEGVFGGIVAWRPQPGLSGGDSNSRRWGSHSGNAGSELTAARGPGGRYAAEVAPHSPVTRRFFPIRGPIPPPRMDLCGTSRNWRTRTPRSIANIPRNICPASSSSP